MIPSITALSQYLLEDLHEHIETPLSRPNRNGSEFPCHSSVVEQPGLPPCYSPTVEKGACRLEEDGRPRQGGPETDPCALRHERSCRSGPLSSSSPYPSTFCAACGANQGISRNEDSPLQFAAKALLRSFTKKFRGRVCADADDVAEEKFRRSNDRCRDWELRIENSWDDELIGCFRKEIDDFFHPCGLPMVASVDQIFENGRCGPGSSLGANGCDFYTKLFSSELTATSYEVYYQYAERAAKYPIWRDAEFNRLITYGLPRIVSESVVTFVQKDLTQTRSICTEPNLNMFFQLGLGEILRARLKEYHGIDLSVQPKRNIRLARRGSIDGSIATIDLESASDSISLTLCREMLPGWFYDLLCDYRTPSTKIKGNPVVLEMVSTMGNGFTFPLQTAIFSCVVRAVMRQYGDESVRACARRARWGVFGDDIICPSNRADRVIRLLTLLGFRVNGDKSYTNVYGRFRESCGGDYYHGHNVRGVYLKHLDTLQSRYVAINLLNEWSARWGVPLPRSVGYLQDCVRLLAVPPHAPIDSGIRVPLALSGAWGWVAYNRKTFSFLYRMYEPDPEYLEFRVERITSTRKSRRLTGLLYNPPGLCMAFVGGYIEGTQTSQLRKGVVGRAAIALKQGENGKYRTRLRVAPFWGPAIEQVGLHRPGFWGWWNTIVEMNLRSFNTEM